MYLIKYNDNRGGIMGYWAKDGAYVYDEHDIKLPETSEFKKTGAPSYDERISFDERQKINIPEFKTTGAPSYDERTSFDERQKINIPEFKTTGAPSYDERTKADEIQVQIARERDKNKFNIINTLMKEMPKNKEDLVLLLTETDFRLDLMKTLVEYYKDQFLYIASQYKQNYTKEASELINSKLTEYLCLIETLKSCGYNFGSEINSYSNLTNYDPYRPDTQLLDIMSIMHVRRKNDANVQIIFPINYDLTNIDFQIKGDAVTIIYNINEHLKNNPNMSVIWSKSGYVAPEEEIEKSL